MEVEVILLCKHCGKPLCRGISEEHPWAHPDPYRLNCYLGEPWTTPEPEMTFERLTKTPDRRKVFS